MLRHAHIGMSHNALDGREVYAQRLHLADIGMSAAVRCKQPHLRDGLQCFSELIPEVGGIAGLIYFAGFPDILPVRLPQCHRAVPQTFRNGYVPVTITGLRNTDGGCSFLHVDGLFDMDDRAIRFDVSWFQCKQLLRTHSRSKHQSDAEADAVVWQPFHEDGDFLRSKGILPLHRFAVAHLFCETYRIFTDEVIGLGLVHDLIHHAPALSQAGNGAPFPTKIFEHGLHIDRLDVLELLAREVCLEDGERKLNSSPYDQAEKNMYYFSKVFSSKYNTKYSGIYGAGVIFPFYPIGEELELSNRHRTCTIDSNDLNNIYDRIKKMFRLWAGSSYGRRYYPASQHRAFLELIRDRIAISAAAGALIRFKDQQLSVINRVQDNYIYLLKNVKQFYMRGGAGTGKTWIAMKMAKDEAESNGHKVLFVCASKPLASMVNSHIGDAVDVKDIRSLFERLVEDIASYQEPLFEGISHGLIGDYEKYDAIFVDEAQDFTEEWASIIRLLLDDPEGSRLGVFFDDVQVLREESFGNGFGIGELPYLLRENIRNTANIYNWTAEKTNLGTDMVANPVEGPTPTTEIVNEHGQLVLLLETLFKRYLEEEYLKNDSLVILTESKEKLLAEFPDGIAKWKFVYGTPSNENEISVYSIDEFKGLEANMVIYIHGIDTTENMNYIAYTRAKYYLIELVRNY